MKLKVNHGKVHRFAAHLHHFVEAIVAIAVTVGHHATEIAASGALGVVCIAVLCLELVTE